MGESTHMGVVKCIGAIQTYRGHTNIWGCPNIQGTSKHVRHLQTYREMSKHTGAFKPVGVPKHMGMIKHTGGHPKHMGVIKHTGGHPNIWGMSKHTGGIHPCTYNTKKECFVRLIGCPYAPICLDDHICWMPPICLVAPKCMGGMQMYGGIYTYGGVKCIGGHPNIQGAYKHMGVSKHTGDIQTCEECPNIQGGVQTYRWASEHMWTSKTYGGHTPPYLQHKDSMLCQTNGVSICPPYVWMTTC